MEPPGTVKGRYRDQRSGAAKVTSAGERALAGTTAYAADACGLGTKGRLRTGYDADLLVVEGDLAADVSMLTRPVSVVLGGREVL